MHRLHRPRRAAIAALAATVVLVLTTTSAMAKDGGMARLAAPLSGDAEPGSTITVNWSLETYVGEDGTTGPFSAQGAYIKLIGLEVSEATGRETTFGSGDYVAEIVVPKGGIKVIEFGIAGTSTVNGVSTRSNMVFQFDGILLQPAVPPAVQPKDPVTEPASNPAATRQPPAGPTISPLAALGALALVLAAVGTVLTLRRRTALA